METIWRELIWGDEELETKQNRLNPCVDIRWDSV